MLRGMTMMTMTCRWLLFMLRGSRRNHEPSRLRRFTALPQPLPVYVNALLRFRWTTRCCGSAPLGSPHALPQQGGCLRGCARLWAGLRRPLRRFAAFAYGARRARSSGAHWSAPKQRGRSCCCCHASCWLMRVPPRRLAALISAQRRLNTRLVLRAPRSRRLPPLLRHLLPLLPHLAHNSAHVVVLDCVTCAIVCLRASAS